MFSTLVCEMLVWLKRRFKAKINLITTDINNNIFPCKPTLSINQKSDLVNIHVKQVYEKKQYIHIRFYLP